MSKLPYMQFYPADWVCDTACLSLDDWPTGYEQIRVLEVK
jgi:hypothetical protein